MSSAYPASRDPFDAFGAPAPPRSAARHTRNPVVALLPSVLALIVACAACGVLAAVGGLQLGAIAFAALVVVLSIVRPSLAFTLALLLSPFVNDVQIGLPVKVAASDLCLFLALPFVFARRHAHFVRALKVPYWLPVAAYLALCAFSTVMNDLDREAIVSTAQMSIYLVFTVAMFAAGMGAADEVLPKLYVVGMVGALLALGVVLGGSNYLFGLHKNSVGSTLGAGFLVMLGLYFSERTRGGVSRRVTLVILIILMGGLLLSLSRGAWIGAGAGAAVILMLYGRVRQAVKLLVLSVPVLACLWLLLPENQREYATDLSAGAHNVKARLDMMEYALGRFRESPLIGVGVGLRKTYDATNVALATLAETGVVGLILFLSIYATLAAMVVAAARRLDRSDPAFALLAIGAALVLAKLLHGMVDHYWGRGVILFWAGAGFVVLGYVQSRRGASDARSQ